VVATHGAAHSQVFEVECSIPKLSIRVSGTGGSRRAAEQGAAKLALDNASRLQASAPRRPKAPAAARATKPAVPAAPAKAPENDVEGGTASSRSAAV
jgi:ribonuclease-3